MSERFGRALVTGGSSGIGLALARLLASEGSDLVLVASGAEALETKAAELRDEFGVDVESTQADLSTTEGVLTVEARLADVEKPIDLLVNNAGIGLHGAFVAADADEHEKVIRLNVVAVTRLTHAGLRAMTARGHGAILNVASVAAFTPGFRPSSTYAASKAFVVALTEGLAPSLEGTGVRISAVCPGFVRSNFHSRAGLSAPKLPGFMWLDADDVARTALHDLRAGHVLSVPALPYKILLGGIRITPRPLVRSISRLVGRRTR